jgi:hypothetical protein
MRFYTFGEMMEIFLSLAYSGFFLYLIGKMPLFRTEKVSVRVFRGLFVVKLTAAVMLYLIYTHYYSDRDHTDIFRYYDDSAVLFTAAFEHPWDFFRMMSGYDAGSTDLFHYYNEMRNWFNSEMIFNDSRTMIRLNVMMRFVAFGKYFPHAIIMSFLGMMGLTGLFRVFIAVLPGREFWMMIVVYLLPSTLLWSSGMIKEAFLLFSIGMLLYNFNNYFTEKKLTLKRISGILFFSFCLLNIKSYVLFAVLPGIISWIVCMYMKKFRWLPALAIHTVYLLLLFNLAYLFTHHPVPELLSSKQHEFYLLAEREHAKSVITLNNLDGTTATLIRNIPSAFLVTLTRPHLLEIDNPFILLAALENLFIISFLIFCLAGINRESLRKMPPVFYPAIYFSIIMFILIGLVTPILGAIVRYKVPALPFLLFAFMCLSNHKLLFWKPGFFKPKSE